MLLDAHVGGMPVCGRDVGEPWRGEGRETDSELNFSCRSRDRDATMNGSVPGSSSIKREYSTVYRYFFSATSLNTFVQTKKIYISFDTDSKDRKPQGDVPATVCQCLLILPTDILDQQ